MITNENDVKSHLSCINKKDVLGIVVAYNISKNDLLENINTYKDFVDEVYVIDNSDKKNDLFQIEDTIIKYKSLNGNLGIAKALNVGMEYGIINNYKYALTMDQDSKFNNNLIEIYNKYYNDKVIIYSPNYIIKRKKSKKYKTKTTEMYWTMTSGNLINIGLYNKIGGFREDFFIDGVDYEYCLRARRAGCVILQCNEAKLIHNPGITKTKNILGYKYQYGYMSPTRLYYQVRNLSYIAKEYNSNKARLIIVVKWLKILLLFDNKKEFLKFFRKARDDFKNGKYGKY